MTRKPVSIATFSHPQAIAALSEQLQQNRVFGIEITAPDGEIRIAVDLPPAELQRFSAAKPASGPTGATLAVAPLAGRFLATHPSRRQDGTAIGPSVTKGQTVGFIAVGPILLPVNCRADGEPAAERPQDGSLAGYGAVLLKTNS